MTGLLARAIVDIRATRDRVWAALTDPALIAQHMWGAKVETDWRVGSPIVWRGEHHGRAYEDKGEILVYDEPERLSVTHFSPLTGQDDVPENYHTLVYTLTENTDGTRVELTQDGCDNQEQVDQFSANWQEHLDGLKRVTEEVLGEDD